MKVLSWDVGIKNLAFCLFEIIDDKYNIIDWNIINLSEDEKHICSICNKNATFQTFHTQEKTIKKYCGIHIKKHINPPIPDIEHFYTYNKSDIKCIFCKTKSSFHFQNNHLCKTHSKKFYKDYSSLLQTNKIKKNKITKDIDIISSTLIDELDYRPSLFQANIVLIENQPALKNPTMKAISSTIRDYYLIRGIKDKSFNSQINKVRFMSPSNKIKLSDKCDIVYEADKKNKYKLTKSLAVEYVKKILDKQQLTQWNNHFLSFKKKDDLADALLQGAYYILKIKN